MEEDNHHPLPADFDPLLLGILGCFAGVFMVAAYHFAANRCTTSHNQDPDESQGARPETWHGTSGHNSALLPTYRHFKVDGTCAVCLSEFEDGEMIRVLPECLHSFHAPCIDMWLYSHSSCPLCRASTRLLLPTNLQRRFVPSSSRSTEVRLPISSAPATPHALTSEDTSPIPVTVQIPSLDEDPPTGTPASDTPHGDSERTLPGPLPTNAPHSDEISQQTPMSAPITSVTIPLTDSVDDTLTMTASSVLSTFHSGQAIPIIATMP